MGRFLSFASIVACCGSAIGQAPPAASTPITFDSTKILPVENFASGQTAP